jgi:hypothetical protein
MDSQVAQVQMIATLQGVCYPVVLRGPQAVHEPSESVDLVTLVALNQPNLQCSAPTHIIIQLAQPTPG